MHTDIDLAFDITPTPRILQAGTLFDVPPTDRVTRHWSVDLPLDDREWQVGLIVGPSGAGKSSVARQCFGEPREFEWHNDRCVLDDFPEDMSIRTVVDLLTAVGFGSPPAWMRPFSTLSTGEQFRVTCARHLAEVPPEETVIIDEFSSVVDRQVAQIASHTLAKTVRREGRKLIAVTCHYDVVDWLQPDWIYQPHAEQFSWRSVQPRPTVVADIHQVDKAAWKLFAPFHYMSASHMSASSSYGLFIEGECVAFVSYRQFVHNRLKNVKMGHRLVVLPDWQGLGLGMILANWCGQHLYEKNWRFRIVTAHPAMTAALNRSPRWRTVFKGKPSLRSKTASRTLAKAQTSVRRFATHSFEYSAPVPIPTLTAVDEVAAF